MGEGPGPFRGTWKPSAKNQSVSEYRIAGIERTKPTLQVTIMSEADFNKVSSRFLTGVSLLFAKPQMRAVK